MLDQAEVQGSPVFQQAKIKVVKENTFFNQKSMDGNRYAILSSPQPRFRYSVKVFRPLEWSLTRSGTEVHVRVRSETS